MRPDERTVLRSYPWPSGNSWEKRFNGGDDSFDVLELRAAHRLRPSPALPAKLGDLELPDGTDAVHGRGPGNDGPVRGRRAGAAGWSSRRPYGALTCRV
ncbi:hypothetical protein [Streptomyces sp. NPDC050149]|uniref:hypothetical protein n=1 Tax=unclassified Streptomyces TaxID=2593676 RepID=UPI003794F6EE